MRQINAFRVLYQRRRDYVVQPLILLPSTLQTLTSSLPQKSITTGNTVSINTDAKQQKQQQPNLHCLSDLPPILPYSVRLYLCRHGQTEYNRLKLIQGSRIKSMHH